MINFGPEKKQKITFRENISSIISEVLEKSGLKEPEEVVIEKIIKGEPTYEGKIAEIIWKIIEGEILLKDLPKNLEKNLNIPEKKAKEVAKELEEKALIPIEEKPEKIEKIPEKLIKPLKIKPPLPSKRDIYREPIE